MHQAATSLLAAEAGASRRRSIVWKMVLSLACPMAAEPLSYLYPWRHIYGAGGLGCRARDVFFRSCSHSASSARIWFDSSPVRRTSLSPHAACGRFPAQRTPKSRRRAVALAEPSVPILRRSGASSFPGRTAGSDGPSTRRPIDGCRAVAEPGRLSAGLRPCCRRRPWSRRPWCARPAHGAGRPARRGRPSPPARAGCRTCSPSPTGRAPSSGWRSSRR